LKELYTGLKIRKKIGDRRGMALSFLHLGEAYTELKNWKKAMKALEKSREVFEEEGDERNLSWFYLTQTEIEFGMVKREKVTPSLLESCQKGLNLARKSRNLKAEGIGYRILARLQSLQGEDKEAEKSLLKSVEIFRQIRIPFELGRSLLELGKWQVRKVDNRLWSVDYRPKSKVQDPRPEVPSQADPREAYASIKEAVRIFEDLGAKTDLNRARSAMDSLTESILSGQGIPDSDWSFAKGEKYLKALYQFSEMVNAIQDEKNLLDRVLDLVIELLGAERGILLLRNEMTGDLFLAVGREVDNETLEDAMRFSHTITKDVAKKGRPIISRDALTDPRFQEVKSVFLQNIRSLLCVPLIYQEEVLGTLYVDSRVSHNLFSEEDESFLLAIANFIAVTIEKSKYFQALQTEIFSLKRGSGSTLRFGNFVGESNKIEEVIKTAGMIAKEDCTVLITGETGTGKDLLARAIHENGKRGMRKFIPIHCGALPEFLLESELFGHTKGAFTDAFENKLGLFEAADGGTIFLDEIGDAPLPVQMKLLRVLQDGMIRRIGETDERKVDVRVICATRRDLEEEIRAKRFREDLYYRLNVVRINLPLLRERKEDIPLLAHHFLREYSERHQRHILGFIPEVLLCLVSFPWPGNVRELMHCIERAVIIANGKRITLEDIDPEVRKVSPKTIPLMKIFDIGRKELINEALRRNGGNITRAAKDLGITYRHLRRLILRYGIDGTPLIHR